MSVLKGKRTYIAGPIEFDTNAYDWRSSLKQFLTNDLGVIVFDPLEDSKQSAQPELIAARDRHDYDTMHAIAEVFVQKDLGIVDRMDFIIAHVPHKVPTTGTVHEIVVSNKAKKPTLLVCPQGKNMAGLWYFGFIPHRHIFGSWDDLKTYLKEVDQSKHMEDKRWRFVYDFPNI
jgi:nucleoside 2-deoxyribosyltransferase